MGTFYSKGIRTEYKKHKKNYYFHIHFLLDNILHIMLNIKRRMMTNEKILSEDKNALLRNSIILLSHSPHQPKNKKPSNTVVNIAIPPSVEPARSGGLNVMCEAIVNAKYSHR